MVTYLYNLFFFRIYHNIWLKLLIIISFVYVFFLIYKKWSSQIQYEGFQQKDKFVLKTDEYAYDDFYIEVYDIIHKPQRRIRSEISAILKQTMPSTSTSVFLDVGCGTGHVVKELNDLGYPAYGVDKSTAMVEYSTKTYPNIMVKLGDVSVDSMLYEKGVFSHVLCLYHTIYHIKNKKVFFENCYYWMKPGAYLIVHLADTSTFDKTVPCGRIPLFPTSSPKSWNTDTIVDFYDFNYKARFQPSVGTTSTSTSPTTNDVLFIESFTDSASGNIRQNEITLHMEPIENIVNMAVRSGFIVQGKYNINEYHDKNQYMYIFERTL